MQCTSDGREHMLPLLCQHAGQLWLPLSRGQRILKSLHFVKSSNQDYKVNAVPVFRPFVVWCGYKLGKGSSENWTGEVSAWVRLHDVTLGRPTLGSCHVHDVGPVWDHSVLRTWRHQLWL